MKKFALSLGCITLVCAVFCMAWLYQTQPNTLLNSTLGKIILPPDGPPSSYGNAINVRESSVVLAKIQVKGLLADGVYNGRITYSSADAKYVEAQGFQWPWNNIIEIVDVNHGQLNRESRAVFQDKMDFVNSPEWSKQGKMLFFVGQLEQYSSSDLAELDPSTNKVQTIATDVANALPTPSPNGRFVAYIEGGQSYPVGPTVPRFLRVRDMKTGKVVGKSLGLSNFFQMSWLASDGLLFNMSDPATQRNSPDSGVMWQINASSGKSKTFRKNAFLPKVSPDGKWFTCLSYDNPSTKKVERALPIFDYKNPKAKTPPIYLVLISADQRIVRSVTDKLPSFAPDIVWTADSKRFAVYEASRQNFGRSSKTAEDIVRIYHIKSKMLKRVGKVQRPPQKLLQGSLESVSCSPLDFTRDGRFLLFVIRNLGGPFAGTTLAAFDTKNGTTQTWFYTSAGGLSWIEN